MKKEKNKNQSFMDGFLGNFVMTRRSFMKKATRGDRHRRCYRWLEAFAQGPGGLR